MIEYERKLIPVSQLVKSPHNVEDPTRGDIPGLADQIDAKGLLQNLIVHKHGERKGVQLYGVAAGGRRREALKLLVKRGKIDADYRVPCIVVKAEDATAASLMENIGRVRMHPASEFAAFKKMVDEGESVEDVAAVFGVDVVFVKRQLKLANVAERFIKMYRADEIGLDELMALAITDDHERQSLVWDGLPEYNRTAQGIRAALTQSELPSTHRLVRYVGLANYEKRGGAVRRDLFSDANTTYVQDVPLLRQIAQENLDKKAGRIGEQEAAPWAVARLDFDYADRREFGEVNMVRVEPDKKTGAKLAALREELAGAQATAEEEGDYNEDLEERIQEIEEEIETIEASLQRPDPAALKIAGIVVTIDSRGKVEVVRGLVRAEDRKELQQIARAQKKNGEDTESTNGAHDSTGFSSALTLNLTAHLTAALRARVAQSPSVALRALVAALVAQVFDVDNDPRSSPVTITATAPNLEASAPDIRESEAGKEFQAEHEAWEQRLQGCENVFRWLLEQSDDDVLRLLAHCTAWSLNAVDNRAPSDAVVELSQAASLDMRTYWRPTAGGFLSRVHKTVIVQAVRESAPEETVPENLKKKDLVAWAEPRLCERQWLPTLLRGQPAVEQ